MNEFTETPEGVLAYRQSIVFWRERIKYDVELDATDLLDRVAYQDEALLRQEFGELNNRSAELELRMGIIASELGKRSMEK